MGYCTDNASGPVFPATLGLIARRGIRSKDEHSYADL